MVDNKAELLWESKDNLNEEGVPYFSVKLAKGYYVYGERLGKDSIAFILYDDKTKKVCLINESKPPLNESLNKEVKLLTAFGGSIDMDLEPERICRLEVAEESGYRVEPHNITLIGSTMVSTQMSQICHLYLVDVTKIKKTLSAEHEIEGSGHEENSIQWLTLNEVIDNDDWKAIYIIGKSMKQGLI